MFFHDSGWYQQEKSIAEWNRIYALKHFAYGGRENMAVN